MILGSRRGLTRDEAIQEALRSGGMFGAFLVWHPTVLRTDEAEAPLVLKGVIMRPDEVPEQAVERFTPGTGLEIAHLSKVIR